MALDRYIETPRSAGRRAGDQVWWAARLVRDLGFPIVAALGLWSMLTGRVDRLTAAVQANTRAVVALACQLDPKTCGQTIRATVSEGTP